MKAKFPGLKSKRWIKFTDKPPEKGGEESEDAFKRRLELFEALKDAELEVMFLDRATVIGFQERYRLAAAKHEVRTAQLDNPSMGPQAEFFAELLALHREVVAAYVTGVRGIEVGDVDLESIKDPNLLVTLLDTAGLLADASMIARHAQSPTPVQLESSGSS